MKAIRSEALELYDLAAPEYAYDDGIFARDDRRVAAAKKALAALPEDDRRLLILYAETGSLRKCGKLMGVSHTWVARRITGIRAEILQKIERYDK